MSCQDITAIEIHLILILMECFIKCGIHILVLDFLEMK